MDTAKAEISTLSLHDALPISWRERRGARPRRQGRQAQGRSEARAARREEARGRGGEAARRACGSRRAPRSRRAGSGDRKSTRLNSSHLVISYAVFCLKKKTKQ